MIIEHRGKRPIIDPSAYIAPNAVVSGDVTIAADTRVLYGAVITSEGAPVRIGKGNVIMENAVIRAAGGRTRSFPVTIGDYALVGPSAYVSGATLEYRAFVGARTVILNGSIIERNAAVTVGAIVHIQTRVPAETVVPLQHIVIGDPCKLFAPSQADAILDELMRRNFKSYVFDLSDEQILAEHYVHSLGLHLQDRVLDALGVANEPAAAALPRTTSPRTTSRRKRS
ncbi:MAG: gamma carbonic anhydrase family protein [Acidobacteriota bacterium]